MDVNDIDENEYGFSRNYFLAKELRGSCKKSAHKLSDIDIVDEQVLASNFIFNSYLKFFKEHQDNLLLWIAGT